MAFALPVDLYSIHKKLIVKKGTLFTSDLVRQLMEHGRKHSRRNVLLKKTALTRDFRSIFNEEKYFTVFTPYSENDKIIAVAENIELLEEVVSELMRVKETLPYTFRHMLLVTAITTKLAIDLKDEGYDPKLACLSGFLHDIGKTRIPKQILGKNSPLTESEYKILKSHSILGYLLLCYYYGGLHHEILNAARDHHEKLNGSGYPRGTAKLGKYAKLIAPPDIFDALISLRPYRQSVYTIRQALDLLIDEANAGMINREIVYYLVSYVRKEHPNPNKLKIYPKEKSQPPPSDSVYGKVIPD